MKHLLIVLVLLCVVVWWACKVAVLGRRFKRAPKPGERWVFTHKGGPWYAKEYSPRVILDVKDGWVRHDIGVFKDQRTELDSFMRMYRPVES